jgi:hypothetical protein
MFVMDETTRADPGQAPRLAGPTHPNPVKFHRKAAKVAKERKEKCDNSSHISKSFEYILCDSLRPLRLCGESMFRCL